MRAVVAHSAGNVRLDERPVPVAGPGEVAVQIRYGGICGSDLHYWRHGRVGDFYLREPLVLGHEVVGTRLDDGTPVAVHPATVCGTCRYCRDDRPNLCPNVRYLGSAARMPHVQGGLADVLVVPADQVLTLPAGLDLLTAAVAEPASVAWHAVRRAGDVRDRRVLVTGAGPIGALVVAALSTAGAGEIVVTDVALRPLETAAVVGATHVVQVGPALDAEAAAATTALLDGLEADLAIESSGTSAGLATCIRAVRRGGRVVSLGLLPPGDSPFPGNLVVTREVELVGAFRFHRELYDVLDALADGRLATGPVVSHVLPVTDLAEAMPLAGDAARSCKVLLDLQPDLQPGAAS
jgi:L-idonate 5-dehydrogenase